MFMLDTNIVSYALRNRPPLVLERLRATPPEDVCISVVTLAELRFGASKSAKAAHYHGLIDTFTGWVQALAFDSAAASTYGDVRTRLEVLGTPIGPLDTIIAAHALSLDAVLVTNNGEEFARVDGLAIEDWTEAP